MADDDFLSTYGQSLNEANQSAADLQRLALANMKSGSPGRMLLGAGQDVLAPVMGVMSPVTAGLDVARKALAYRFGEPVGNAFDVASTVMGGPEDIVNALRLAGKVSPVAAMAALPRRSGSLETIAQRVAENETKLPDNLIPDLPKNRNTQVFPELQKRYPLTAPPVEAIDKNSGKPYLAKQNSAEADAVAKARLAIQRDINEGNYTPYFDPAKRADVDPSNYPEYVSTTNILKAKPETREKYDTLASAPGVGERFEAAYKKGLEQKENSENWYFMKQLEDEFVKEYGPKEGRIQFKNKFADAMAATTGGADPTANLLMAHYGNYLKNQGLSEFPPTYALPYPIGGQYAKGNLDQYRKMLMEGAGVTPANPKRYNFLNNFLGNKGATIDEQMSDIFQPGMGMPPAGTYGHYENSLNNFSQKAGAPDPRYFQEVAWAGEKDAKTKGGYKSKPMISFVNEAIERTSRLTGMSPEEVVRRGLVRSEIPLYGAAGFAALNGLNSSSNETEPNFNRGGHVSGDDTIKHALRLAIGGRAHFGFGGDSDAAEGSHYSANISHDSVSNDGPEQHESLNAFEARQDPQRYSDYEGNRLTAGERSPSVPEGQAHFVPSGLGQVLFKDNSGEVSVGQNTRSDVAGPTANQIATEQANQEENRAMAANAAMAQRIGPMTGQPETPTFTGNTTEEQQLKDAEASQRAAINAAITGANYTAPGTVSAADVATPVQSNITSNTSPFADIANRYTTAAQTGAANLGDMARMLERQGAITSATGTPLQSLAAVQPTTSSTNPIDSSEAARNAQFQERLTRNLGKFPQYTIDKINSVFNPDSYYGYTPTSQQAAINAVLNSGQPIQTSSIAGSTGAPVVDNTPLEASALYRAATFEPSQNAALRAARDAISQNMGQPDIAVARTTGLGSATPADLPAAKAAPQATTTANEAPRIPVNSLEDPALIAAYNAKYGLAGPKNTMADMALGQRIPNVTTNNPFVNTVQGLSNILTDMFTPNYKLGSDEYNKISQNPEPVQSTHEGRGGDSPQPYIPYIPPVGADATPVSAPVVPATPVPYTYATRTPYLNYGANGSGIGNIAPISYADPINWALVPGYRASGGKVGENNALANAIRLLAMQNRS